MGEKRTGKRWGPQHPHKHPPPTMLVQIWGRSSPFPAARDQPKTRCRSQGSHHFPGELVVLVRSAQNRSNLSVRGSFHSGFAPQATILEAGGREVPARSAGRQPVLEALGEARTGPTSSLGSLELTGTQCRAWLCCLQPHRQGGKGGLRAHPLVAPQVADDSSDAPGSE